MMSFLCVRRFACALPALLSACAGANDSASSADRRPPRAEFLVGAADSMFWVSSSNDLKVRGAPLVVARYDGRFYEIYAHHEDLSYPDAVLLGDRLYRRDLLTGDSTVVFTDTVVPRMAREYAASHPDERPLEPNEDGEADPSTAITAEVDVLDVYGPYLSYEYHLDVERPGKTPWHTTRHGVIDLRTGRTSRVTDLLGQERGAMAATTARRSFERLRDSVARERPRLSEDHRRAAAALAQLEFDETSFALSAVDGRLAVSFAVPGAGEGAAGSVMELDPIDADSLTWWPQVARGFPVMDDAGNDVWRGRGYSVVARYDTSGGVASLSLADSGRETPLFTTHAPLFQVTWLDDPAIRDEERRALTRAFNHAAAYDEGARVAAAQHAVARRRTNVHFASIHAHRQNGPGKSARNVRAHDAAGCEQHGACVRWRHSVDDGQMRGDRGISSQPYQRRHRVDRPG
jgi:hypothetical protein